MLLNFRMIFDVSLLHHNQSSTLGEKNVILDWLELSHNLSVSVKPSEAKMILINVKRVLAEQLKTMTVGKVFIVQKE